VQEIVAALHGPAPWRALATRAGRGAAEVHRLASVLEQVAAASVPSVQIGHVLAHYVPILRRIHRDDHPKRERDLEHFATIAERYRETATLLVDMALEPPTDSVGGVLAASDDDEGLVTLSTIHSAKGLEWHTVFLIWAADGRFPSMYNMDGDDALEEERRLMYVAMTRAKDLLYVTYPIEMHERGMGIVLGKPSRFLEDLGEDVLEPIALVDEPRAGV
jgi:DNA helicase-2/ATP-dependent DNA helicase PcrA